jgi:hypothetical protein
MNLKDISTELSKVNAKIDNFTILGVALMADQKKLLDIALSSQPSTISEPTKRDDNNDQTLLWNTIEQLRREMTEQKLFYENQLADKKAEADQAFARQETKLEKMRNGFEDLRATLTSKITDMESNMSSLTEKIAEMAQQTTPNDQQCAEESTESQRNEIEKLHDELNAQQATITSKTNEIAVQKPAIELSVLKEDEIDAKIYEKINLAFQKTYHWIRKTDEKVRIIYTKAKKEMAENHVNYMLLVNWAGDITKNEKLKSKYNCYMLDVLERAPWLLLNERHFPDITPSFDYFYLLISLYGSASLAEK